MYLWMLDAYFERCQRLGVSPSFAGANAFKHKPRVIEFRAKCEKWGWKPTAAQYRGFEKTYHLRGRWENVRFAPVNAVQIV